MSVSKKTRRKAGKTSKTTAGKPAKAAGAPRTASAAGRVLTVKQLPEAAYQAFHKLPHGVRMATMRMVLNQAAVFAKKTGVGWHAAMLRGDVSFGK